MATRSNIIVEDRDHRIQLYRHWDGYPDGECGVLATLEQALPYAWPLPRYQADDFAAAIVRAWKEAGGNIYIDGSPKAWEMIHGDIEWVYRITPPQDASKPIFAGIPIVQVYDWHKYWFDKGDPDRDPPSPVIEVKITEARSEGLNRENSPPA